MADDAPELELADQLEREAEAHVGSGADADAVTLALEQLRADRTNGEPLDTSLGELRAALDQVVAADENTAADGAADEDR